MYKCIMVKIGEAKSKLSKASVNFAAIRGIYKFCGNRGDMQYASFIGLGG